jgi:hypothetical protein
VTVPTDPTSTSSGWQAGPAGAVPRAARQPAANGLLLTVVVLFGSPRWCWSPGCSVRQ